MKRRILILFSLIIFIIPLFGCKNIQKYAVNENDSYTASSFISGGNKGMKSRITKINCMNLLGNERIVLHTESDEKEALPYYEVIYDRDDEFLRLTVFDAEAENGVLNGTDKADYDLLESLEIYKDDGNIVLRCETDDDIRYKVEENTGSMQIVLHIRDVLKEEK